MPTYAGDPSSFPPDGPIPDDTAAPTASVFNAAVEPLADRTAWLKTQLMVLESHVFTASGSVVVPFGATHAWLEGCGGGGGGGGGGPSGAVGCSDSAGGGGGGARRHEGIVAVAEGDTLTIAVGAGGAGGTPGNDGGDGGDSSVINSTPTVLMLMRGAQGGSRGTNANTRAKSDTDVFLEGAVGSPIPSLIYQVSGGGDPTRGNSGNRRRWRVVAPSEGLSQEDTTFQAGGWGLSRSDEGFRGNPSPEGYDGGVGGTSGTDDAVGAGTPTTLGSVDTTAYGGGGGGGGGAGPYGVGADGGGGSNGEHTGTSVSAGHDGSAAAASTGAGGGGGGAAGSGGIGGGPTAGPTGGNVGGSGGAGGSGRVTIVFVRKAGT